MVWIVPEEASADPAERRLVVEVSSPRAAALYVAAARRAELHLSLADPLDFLSLLADVRAAPVLRAA